MSILLLVRLSKGAGFADAYSLLSRPFWPGSAQREWLDAAMDLEQRAKLKLLEDDNRRLRGLVGLQNSGEGDGQVSAAVISRTTRGWWQQMELGKGALQGLSAGDAVLGPGGLVGRIQSVTPTTSRVKLLTAPGTRSAFGCRALAAMVCWWVLAPVGLSFALSRRIPRSVLGTW